MQVIKAYSKFVPSFVLFLIILTTIKFGETKWIHPQIWYIFLFFAILDFLVIRISEIGFLRENFINFYLSAVVIRMILIVSFAGVFMYFFPENRKIFLITCLVFYLFFSVFEISGLIRKLRRF